jgi:outer membrane protein OmpA-like peptidoglycan-associated protein
MSTIIRRRRQDWSDEAPEQEYWLSYSDLMAGLLMVFVLMLLISLDRYGGPARIKMELDGATAGVIDDLQQAFRDSRGVVVDPLTGAVRFPDAVLFDEGSAVIRPEGRTILADFGPRYMRVMAGDSVRDYLQAIAIEGHTNDNGGYMYNLDLSQRRAFAVMQFLLSTAGEHEAPLRRYATANGESFRRQMCLVPLQPGEQCPPTQVDRSGSRRIEIRFRLAVREPAPRS